MRVLVVRLGAFGDLVHTLPLAADLAAAGHAVGWLCESRWLPVLDGSPAIAALHGLDRKRLKRGSAIERLALMRELRRALAGRYDAAIDAQGLAKSALCAALAGCPRRVGFARPRARELSWLLPARRVPAAAVHVIDQQRTLGLGLGVRAAGGWRFPLPAWTAERAAARAWLAAAGAERPWIINVGAGWPTKVWPETRQTELARAVAARGAAPVLLWGSPDERAAAERIAAAAPGARLAPPTTIPQAAGLLAQAEVVVSGDTGPLHLAHALGAATVGLFGPVPRERNGPRGPRAENLQAPGAAWERRDLAKVDMGAIAAADVLAAADRVRMR